MTTQTEALKLALEALEKTQNEGYNLPGSAIRKAITAIKEALAQPEQEPVAHQYQDREGVWKDFINEKHYKDTVADGTWPIRALYTTPPQRPSRSDIKPLTDEDLDKLADLHRQEYGQLCDAEDLRMFARAAIEAAHGIKE